VNNLGTFGVWGYVEVKDITVVVDVVNNAIERLLAVPLPALAFPAAAGVR
jgi:hypothetical protein